jgi:hypothetical protein
MSTFFSGPVSRRRTIAFAIGLAALLPPAVPGQTAGGREPSQSFTERIEVTAVEIMIEVLDRKEQTPAGLTAADFEVLEDGEPVEVIGLEYPPQRLETDLRELPPASAEPQEAWRFLVYLESVLSAPSSIRKVVRALSDQAFELTELGSVEVVLADPAPQVVLPFSRDPQRLREAFDSLSRPRRRLSELAEIRRNFLAQRDLWITVSDNPVAVNTAQAVGQIRAALQEEQDLVERQMERFRLWLDAYGNVPASAVILVTDGFDVDPSEFYLQATAAPGIERELVAELRPYRFAALNERLSRELSARGWTGLAIALGGSTAADVPADASLAGRERFRSIGELGSAGPASASLVSLLQRPTEPLEQIAQASGGEVVVSVKKAETALRRLGDRLRLTYQANRPADGKRRRLEVRFARSGLEVRAPRWVSSPTPAETAVSLARRLLVLGAPVGEVPVEVRRGSPDGGRTRLTVLFDLSHLREVLPGARFPIRFTIGVALAEEKSFVHQMTEEVSLPAQDAAARVEGDPKADAGGRLPRFSYTVFLDLPPDAGRIAVIVEEPATGSWGGNVAGVPPAEGSGAAFR